MIKSKKSFIKFISTVVLTSSLFFSSLPIYCVNADNFAVQSLKADYGLTNNIKDGAILHAWSWSFNTIKQNMKDIAEAGFSSVQTSPANACIVGENGGMDLYGNGKWYYHYQPTDWKLGNYQLGTRQEFKEMCAEADKYGIKIIVDVVPNHTTPNLGAVSQDLKNAVGGQDNLYHANGFNEITGWGWGDRRICTTGAALGLPDVNTENPKFQKYFLNYLNDCIDCGADGFRYDTAKHIGLPTDPLDAKSQRNNFWSVATGKESVEGVRLKDSDRIFNYGEVLQGDNVDEVGYSKYVSETASNYGGALRSAILSKDFSTSRILDWRNAASPDKLVTWVESHDTYTDSNDGQTSYKMSDWQIRMAWAVIAARKDGTPLFYNRPDGSNQSNRWGRNKIGIKGNNEFKNPEVVEVNKFRNAMVGQSEYLRNINGDREVLAIERGNKGEVIVNLGGGKNINEVTNLANGTYYDKVSGREFKVSGGRISGYLEGGKVTVLYNSSSPNPSYDEVDRAGIYFNKPASWGNDIKIYVYDEKTDRNTKILKSWPGESMQRQSNGEYFFQLPSSWNWRNTQVIFSDGRNQYPSSIGLSYELGTAMRYINGSWTKLKIKNQK